MFFQLLARLTGASRGYRKLSVMFSALGSGPLPVAISCCLCTWMELSNFSYAAPTTETNVSNHLRRQLKCPPPPPTDEAKMQNQMCRLKSNQTCRFMRNDSLRLLISGWGRKMCTAQNVCLKLLLCSDIFPGFDIETVHICSHELQTVANQS